MGESADFGQRRQIIEHLLDSLLSDAGGTGVCRDCRADCVLEDSGSMGLGQGRYAVSDTALAGSLASLRLQQPRLDPFNVLDRSI